MRPHSPAPSLLTLDVLWMAALLTAIVALTGCGAGPRLIPSSSGGPTLQGHVHGGQQPISGARVYLLAAGTGGYGTKSVPLLDPIATGNPADSIGSYVVTAADGSFTLADDDYTCLPGQQVYVLVHNGDSGGGNNTAVGLMAVLGGCPLVGSFAAIPYIEVNEVSTVAAAYALSGFATTDHAVSDDETDLSNTTPAAAHTGLANAFANASNLVDLGTGVALTTTPAGNSIVPQATINTLANILAACINTADPTEPDVRSGPFEASARPLNIPHSTTCNTLLRTARSAGTSGDYPSTTAGAAINIAHYPTANVAALYTLAGSKPPFSPALGAQPNDFSLTLSFTPTQLGPNQMAFDASGNLWYVYNGGLAELTPLGAEAPGSPFADANLDYPFSLAIDVTGNIWTPDYSEDTLTEFSSSGSLLQSNPINGFNNPTSIAIDPLGDLWISNQTGSLTETSSFGTLVNTFSGGGLTDPYQVLSDGDGDLWLPNPNGSDVALFDNTGTPFKNSPLSATGVFPSSGYQVAGLDSSGNLWTLNSFDSSIGGISSTSAALPNTPFNSGAAPSDDESRPRALALDGQSNIWAVITYDSEDEGVRTGSPQPLSAHPEYAVNQTPTLYGFTPSGTSLLGSSFVLPGSPKSIAIDPAGNLWYSVQGVGFYEIVGLAAPVITPLSAAVTSNKIATLP